MLFPRQQALLGITIILLVGSWITLLLRTWARAGLIHQFGLDDKIMILGVILYTVHATFLILATFSGYGVPSIELLDSARAERALMYNFFQSLFYFQAIAAVKCALGFQLLRIAVQPLHIWILRFGLIYASIICAPSSFFRSLFTCVPVRAYWTPAIQSTSHCMTNLSVKALLELGAVSVVLCDLVLCVLPLFILKDLQMTLTRKIVVACLLSAGSVGAISTIPRMVFIPESFTPDKSTATLPWLLAVGYIICIEIELGLSIILGSLATLTPLFKLLRGKLGLTEIHSNWERRMATWHTPRAARQTTVSVSGQPDGPPNNPTSSKAVRKGVHVSMSLADSTSSLENFAQGRIILKEDQPHRCAHPSGTQDESTGQDRSHQASVLESGPEMEEIWEHKSSQHYVQPFMPGQVAADSPSGSASSREHSQSPGPSQKCRTPGDAV